MVCVCAHASEEEEDHSVQIRQIIHNVQLQGKIPSSFCEIVTDNIAIIVSHNHHCLPKGTLLFIFSRTPHSPQDPRMK